IVTFLFFFFFHLFSDHRHLLSFPTRRSSDLWPPSSSIRLYRRKTASCIDAKSSWPWTLLMMNRRYRFLAGFPLSKTTMPATFSRSEEHTSELQSRENLVCRLLLEKKKKQL